METESLNHTLSWEDEEHYDDYGYWWPLQLLKVLQGTGSAVALVANVLLLVLFGTAPHLCNTPNTLLLQRAVADLGVSMISIFSIAYNDVWEVPAGCTAGSVIIHVGTVASRALLMAFTVDGYQAAYPQHHTLLFRRKMMIGASVVSWSLAVTAGIAAFFMTEVLSGYCNMGPLFTRRGIYMLTTELFIQLVVPLVVVWALVSVALPPRAATSSFEDEAGGKTRPNRRLLLGLASSFTVLEGLYWCVSLLSNEVLGGVKFSIIHAVAYSLPHFCDGINAILVICLTDDLRRRVAGWLPSRRSASVPLREL